MFRPTVLATLFMLVPMFAQAAPCAKRTDFLQHLATKFAEAPVAMGVTADGAVLEILTSAGGPWTILVTMPTGVTCGVVAGEAWSQSPAPTKPDGDTPSRWEAVEVPGKGGNRERRRGSRIRVRSHI